MDVLNKVYNSLATRDAVLAQRFLTNDAVRSISTLRSSTSQRESLGHLITEKLSRHPVSALECVVALNESEEDKWLTNFECIVAEVVVALIIF